MRGCRRITKRLLRLAELGTANERILAEIRAIHVENEARYGSPRVVDELRERGHEVTESDANFVLFGVFRDRHAVWQGLLDRGVLIRETGPDGWLRVSIGTADEMMAFKEALTEVRTSNE